MNSVESFNLEQALEKIKKRTPMYFENPTVEALYAYLLGWDMSKDTKWCNILIQAISNKKKTGSKVPDSTDISFEEALDLALEMARWKRAISLIMEMRDAGLEQQKLE